MKREKPEAGSRKPEGEKRKYFAGFRAFAVTVTSGFWLLASGFFFIPGCAKSDRESAGQRSEKTLRDPMDYSPQFEKTDVSGGGWLDYDRDGMRKDLKNVLDP
jgi:hypothetical protein